jgi:hypothetical protein
MENTNTTNTTTYTVTVDSCESCPKIVASFDAVPENRLKDVLYYATKAFRSVEVINNDTGEVALTLYQGLVLFDDRCRYSYGDALDYMRHNLDKE